MDFDWWDPQVGTREGGMAGEGISHGWASSRNYLMGGGHRGKPRAPSDGGKQYFPRSRHPGTPRSTGDITGDAPAQKG